MVSNIGCVRFCIGGRVNGGGSNGSGPGGAELCTRCVLAGGFVQDTGFILRPHTIHTALSALPGQGSQPPYRMHGVHYLKYRVSRLIAFTIPGGSRQTFKATNYHTSCSYDTRCLLSILERQGNQVSCFYHTRGSMQKLEALTCTYSWEPPPVFPGPPSGGNCCTITLSPLSSEALKTMVCKYKVAYTSLFSVRDVL